MTTWFLAIYHISQAKTGLSVLALKQYLGPRYPAALLIQHKLVQEMKRAMPSLVHAQVDDMYLGGELSRDKRVVACENKVPSVKPIFGRQRPSFAYQTHPSQWL
ncbi:MAG: hypothetical protein Q8N35_17050 [Methylococcaceae bacterium]|nr:hypothetical protein [Methylococcaceae bacterium]MDP2392397.1 hypothetical protein [Methylococcaceae bacterium]MDP3021291.1 hypothetical protein [Methylococcaceae bacterium]MDP3390875.1 hypothetical protein [Methylococcaceae bacterium]